MRTVFSSLVAVSLLIHAAFGCCWHHLHETAGEGHSDFGQAIAAESEHGHADCPCGCNSHSGNAPHSPSKDRPHCQGICQYLPPQKTQLDTFSALAALDFAVVATTTIDVPTITTSNFALALAEPARPPVRLHLFQQLLLI
jgi:hypothetical protein